MGEDTDDADNEMFYHVRSLCDTTGIKIMGDTLPEPEDISKLKTASDYLMDIVIL